MPARTSYVTALLVVSLLLPSVRGVVLRSRSLLQCLATNMAARLVAKGVIAGLLVCMPQSGWAASVFVMNFDSLQTDNANANNTIGSTYVADGFQLTATGCNPMQGACDFNYAGTQSSSYAGVTMLFHHITLGEIQLTRVDGGKFSLLSIDLAELPPFDTQGNPINNGPFDLTFYGYRNGQQVRDQTFSVEPFPTVTAFDFQAFSALDEVKWFQGFGGSAGAGFQTHQFTNITVRKLPEPATFALLGLVAAGLVWGRRTLN